MPNTIYTNKPEFAGEPGYKYLGSMQEEEWEPETLEIVPGVKYTPEKREAVEYSPEGADYGEEKKGWTLSAIVRAFPDAFNIDPADADAIEKGEKTRLQMAEEAAATKGMSLDEYLKTPYGRLAAKYGKAPEGWGIPDYSAEGRKRFEQKIFKQVGGDPHKFDPSEEVEKASSYFPTLFKQVFGNQVLYEDRYKMNKKQKDHWSKEVNKFRAAVKDDAVAMKDKMMKEYDFAMNKFDRRAKEWAAANEELYGKTNERRNAFSRKLKVKNRKMTVEEFNQANAEGGEFEWGDPMAEDKDLGPSPLDVQRLFKLEEDMLSEENLVDGRVREDSLRAANRMRAAMNLPLLEEIAGEKPAWGPVRQWWKENMPGLPGGVAAGIATGTRAAGAKKEPPMVPSGEYEYREKPSVDVGKRVTEAEETATGKLRAINPDTGEPYPDGTRAVHTDPETGEKTNIVTRDGYWEEVE